jgi:hypothetical protein
MPPTTRDAYYYKRCLLLKEMPPTTRDAYYYKRCLDRIFGEDHVVHQKKKLVRNGRVVKRNGKPIWLKPHYTKMFTHTTSQGKRVKCKGGTQIIDRFWQHVHKHIKNRPHAVRSIGMTTRIRSAQWAYWHRDEDMWLETGEMLGRLSSV